MNKFVATRDIKNKLSRKVKVGKQIKVVSGGWEIPKEKYNEGNLSPFILEVWARVKTVRILPHKMLYIIWLC